MKIKAAGFALMSMFLTLGLTSCDTNPHQIDNPQPYIDNNLVEREQTKLNHYKNYTDDHSFILKDYSVVNSSYASAGLLVVRNETGHIGFYSLTHECFIRKCAYYFEWLDYDIVSNSAGVFIKIYYENKLIIFDNLGNEFLNTISDFDIDDFDVKSIVQNKDVYIRITCRALQQDYRYSNGKAMKVYTSPFNDHNKPDIPDIPELDDDEHEYVIGDLFKEGNIIDLSEYGKDGYYLSCTSRGLTSLFDENDTFINAFLIPTTSQYAILKGYIYYQERNPLPDDNESYTFFAGHSKYSLKTHQIDMFDGVDSEIDFDYVVNSVIPYKDATDHYTQALMTVNEINEYLTLDEPRTYLMDSDFKILGDYTQVHPEAFIKLANGNYYNLETKILYNQFMNPITHLAAMDPQYLYEAHLFKGRHNGKIGFIDESGRVAIPFEYDEVILNPDFKYAILHKGDEYILFNLEQKSNERVYANATIRIIDSVNEIYAFETETYVDFYCLDGTHFKRLQDSNYYDKDFYSFKGITPVLAFNDNACIIVSYYLNSGVYYKVFRPTDETEYKISAKGYEYTNLEKTGRNYEDAAILRTGTNHVHANPDNGYTYTVFSPTTSGFYSLTSDSQSLVVEGIYTAYYDTNLNETRYEQLTSYNSLKEIPLVNSYSYYFILRITGYKEFKLSLSNEFNELSNEKVEFDSYSNQKVCAGIQVEEDGYYEIYVNNFDYTISKINKTGLHSFNYSVRHYDEKDLIFLTADNYYVFTFTKNSSYSPASYLVKEYNDLSVKLLSYDETYDLNNSHALRKVSNVESLIVSHEYSTSVNLYYIGSNENAIKVDTYKNYDSFDYYQLDKNKTYYIDIYCSTNKVISNLILPGEYNSLPESDLISSYVYVEAQTRTVTRFTVATSGYYKCYFSSFDSSYNNYPKIYKIDENNKLIEQIVNNVAGSKCYPLEANAKYIFSAYDSSYYADNYRFSFTLLTYDNLNTIPTHSTSSYTSSNFYKYTPSKTGYYTIANNPNAAMVKVYQRDDAKNEYTLVEPTIEKGTDYYYLVENTNYVIYYQSISTSYSYHSGITYVIDDLANLPDYIINANAWSSSNGVYQSTNKRDSSTSSMTITANSNMTLTFNYDVSSEYSYDEMIIYVNNVVKNRYSGSIRGQTYTLNLNAGDVVKIAYTKDSSRSSGSDMAKIYNIQATII